MSHGIVIQTEADIGYFAAKLGEELSRMSYDPLYTTWTFFQIAGLVAAGVLPSPPDKDVAP